VKDRRASWSSRSCLRLAMTRLAMTQAISRPCIWLVEVAGVEYRDMWTHCPGWLQWVILLQLCMCLQLCVGSPFEAPNALDHDAGFDGSYGAPPAVVAMAAWVFKIVMKPGSMVQCCFYKNV
jgi:hypothetical protein